MRNMRTYTPKGNDITRKWYLIDAKNKVLGRIATQIVNILNGKNKPEYTPFIDTGDFVVVINAEKVAVTGKKEKDKIFYKSTGYHGNLKKTALGDVRIKHPERLIFNAVKGMLPHNSIGRDMIKKLRVCVGETHEFQAQKPELITNSK